MKHIAAIALAACSLLASAQGVTTTNANEAATLDKFRELFGIDLDAKWDGPTTDFKLEKNFGPFRSGYVYTNEVGLVHQVQLVEDCLVADRGRNYEKLNSAEVERYGGNAASNVLPHVERDLKAAFVGMADFRPRQGRSEYVYGTTSELPGVSGWHVACYACPRCDKKGEQGNLRISLVFWTKKERPRP